MRHISRLTLSLSALAFACALGASGPARALDEAQKPKAEDSAEPKREDSKDTKSEEKTEKREEKTDAGREQKPKAARDEKSAEKSADKKKHADTSAYLRKLGQLIRARSPGATNLGEGSAVVRFRLGASGAPDSVTLVSASTPRHGQLARSIVSGLRAPPPPGGSYDGVQSFRFH
jgi:outer membrane biosynthesis protein TonB